MATDDTYNGWANYESWVVALWLDNEPASQEWVHDLVHGHASDYAAGDALRDALDTIPAGFIHDLLSHAMARVDWPAVARHFREE